MALQVRIPEHHVSCVCCVLWVEAYATGRSLVQGRPTECGASMCDREASTIRRPRPITDSQVIKKNVATNTCSN